MPDNLASRIDLWAKFVADMPRYNEDIELSTALVWRDEIHEKLQTGVVLSADSARQLAEADSQLLELRDTLVERFPEVFEDRAPYEYWWWRPDKTPVPATNQ